MQEVSTPAGYTIIDDAYNASPESMLAAFDTIADAPKRGRLLAVLGEMRELGVLSAEAHRRVGQRAAEVFDAVCVLQDERAREMAEAAGAEVSIGDQVGRPRVAVLGAHRAVPGRARARATGVHEAAGAVEPAIARRERPDV